MSERTPEHEQELALQEVEGADLDTERVADEVEPVPAVDPEVPEADAIEQASPGPPEAPLEETGAEG
jgi:hypothetical protein